MLHDKAIKWAKAKVRVYSGSVLCLGKMYEQPEANARWKDQRSDIFTCTLVSCVIVSSLHLRTLPQGPWHRVTPIRTLPTQHIGSGAGYCSFRWSTTRSSCAPHSSGRRLLVSGIDRRRRDLLCSLVINLFSIDCGAMASSAVSSVLYLRDAAGNHVETRTGAYIYHWDAASFHERECRTRLRNAVKSGDQYIEVISKICDGLRGDAFVAAQEVGFDNLCEIVDVRPRGIDTLINIREEWFFPRQNTNLKNYSASTCRPRRTPVQTKWRNMKQCVSRQRRCWTLLVQMDPVSSGTSSSKILGTSITCSATRKSRGERSPRSNCSTISGTGTSKVGSNGASTIWSTVCRWTRTCGRGSVTDPARAPTWCW